MKRVDNLFVKTTKGLHQTLAMAEKDKNDTEESDLEDYLDDDLIDDVKPFIDAALILKGKLVV